MVFDAIVVGGSFAGLSAAMQLARARRRVLVVDSGLPRNRFAATSHGFLGQDGKAPPLQSCARPQVRSPPIPPSKSCMARRWRRGRAETASLSLWPAVVRPAPRD